MTIKLKLVQAIRYFWIVFFNSFGFLDFFF